MTVAVVVGTLTEIVLVPTIPLIVAEICADPTATPVTRPVDAPTVATAVLDDVHVAAGRPVRDVPLASFGVAESCSVPLTMTADAPPTVTVAIGPGGAVVSPPPPHPAKRA